MILISQHIASHSNYSSFELERDTFHSLGLIVNVQPLDVAPLMVYPPTVLVRRRVEYRLQHRLRGPRRGCLRLCMRRQPGRNLWRVLRELRVRQLRERWGLELPRLILATEEERMRVGKVWVKHQTGCTYNARVNGAFGCTRSLCVSLCPFREKKSASSFVRPL